MTKEMQYMSLDQDAAEWANKILSFYSAEVDAQAMNEAVRKTGFDIKENAKWLEAFYENALLQD